MKIGTTPFTRFLFAKEFCMILCVSLACFSLAAQTISRVKSIDVTELDTEYKEPVLSFKGDFVDQSKLELLLYDKRSRNHPMILNYDAAAVSLYLHEHQLESYQLSGFPPDFSLVKFKNEHFHQVLIEDLFATRPRFYSPFQKDVVLDYNSEIDDSRIAHDLNGDGYPEVMGLTSDDVYTVYSYTNVWSPEKIYETEGRRYSVVLQADDDPELELLLYGSGSSQLIDPFAQEEKELSLPFGGTKNIVSFMMDGKPKLLVAASGSKLRLYDFESNTIEKTTSINSSYSNGSIACFYTIDSDGNAAPYIAFLNNNLTILNLDFKIVLEVLDIENGPGDHVSRNIVVHDSDKDGKPNILFMHDTSLSDYEISGLGTYYEPFNITGQYPAEGQVVSDGSFYLNFDSYVSQDALAAHLAIQDINDTDKQISYSLATDDNLLFVISPAQPLQNSNYKLVLSKDLRARNQKRLDINKDQFVSDTDDKNYELCFSVNSTSSILPTIDILSQVPDSIYADTKYHMKIGLNSNSEAPILSFLAGFENGAQTKMEPMDGVYDFSNETVEFTIDASGLPEGNYNYKLVVETYDRQSTTMNIQIQIVEVHGYPYSIRGVDDNNSNYQPREVSSPFFEHAWDRDAKMDLIRDQIKGENGFIYYMDEQAFRETTLNKVELSTNTLMWKIDFGIYYLSDVTVKDGYLYFAIHDEELRMRCHDAANGSLVWETEFDHTGSITGSYFPVVVHEDYVLISHSSGIKCFDRWTGRPLWSKLRSYMRTNVIVHNNIVYSSDADYIYSFDIETGEEIYRFSDPSISSYNSRLLLDSNNGQLIYYDSNNIYAFDISSWTRNWVIEENGHKDLALREESLFFQTSSREVFKADLKTGIVSNRTLEISGNTEKLFLYGDYLAVSNSFPSTVSFYDAETLDLKGSIPANGQISMVDDYLLVSGNTSSSAYKMELRCYDDEYRSEILCKGDSITIYGETYTYSGTYLDTIETTALCHTVLNLNVSTTGPTIKLSVITNSTGNDNGRIELRVEDGTAPYTYLWSEGQTTSIIENLAPGVYTVTITDANGCELTDTFVIEDKQCAENGGDADGDSSCADVDCDDNNSFVYPGQIEVPYNGLDDDCNQETLDDDLDRDGYFLDADCNDSDATVNPGQVEIPYNGKDDDCNPATLDDDLDGDGYVSALDCDDSNALVNPSQPELPYNGIDDDCNSASLDDDLDQDEFINVDDCDDNNSLVYPGQTEGPYNGIDDDCNPLTFDDDLDQDGFLLVDDCDDQNAAINPAMVEEPYNGVDDDCDASTLDDDLDADGYMINEDCDDTNINVNPGEVEKPYNGLDDDCNVATLDDDLDQDGFSLSEDCDDENMLVNPDQVELPYNNTDDDCDPMTLDDDLDQDGFLYDYDCNDQDSTIYPGAIEIANNDIDEDCDGYDFISATHSLSTSTLKIYPNPTREFIHIEVDGNLSYAMTLYNLQGKLVMQAKNATQISISDLPQGMYLLEIRHLNTNNRIVENIIKRE